MPAEFLKEWLGKIRHLEGTFCDVIIRVTVATSNDTIDIPCHSLVLSTRSDHFDRALRGGFKEKDTKVICINRHDEEDLKCFKLLLELSYAPSYIHDDEGAMLDRDTRLALALMANEYEFNACIDECVASLSEGLELEEQIMYVEVKLAAFHGRECITTWKTTILEAIAAGGLGPVREFFEEGHVLKKDDGVYFYEMVPLKAVIKSLPVEGMEALLGSDKLDVHVEDEAYYLLGAWLHQSAHVKAEDMVSVFKSLAAKIRFHHISADFLACVVTCCPLACESGLALSFLRSGLMHREASKQLLAAENCDVGPPNRGSGNEELTFITSALLDYVSRMEIGSSMSKYIGVVAGFPICVGLDREENDTLGLYLHSFMPQVEGETFASCLERRVGFGVTFESNSVLRSFYDHINDDEGFGCGDFFEKPWGEVVYENSPYFPEGKMSITITLKKFTKDDDE
jgi:hypothetical protein